MGDASYASVVRGSLKFKNAKKSKKRKRDHKNEHPDDPLPGSSSTTTPQHPTDKEKASKPKRQKLDSAKHTEEEPKEQEKIIAIEKTEAERKFEEVQRKRRKDRISRIASKSHKERVDDLNRYLGTLTEHYDIPKVGPG